MCIGFSALVEEVPLHRGEVDISTGANKMLVVVSMVVVVLLNMEGEGINQGCVRTFGQEILTVV